MTKSTLKSVFFIAALCLVASCGSRGELKAAPPMWGKAKEEYKAEQAKKAEEEKAKQDTGETKE